jgi:hypothetical protein
MSLKVRKRYLSEFSFNTEKQWLYNVGCKSSLCPHTITCLCRMNQVLHPTFHSGLGNAGWNIPNGLDTVNGGAMPSQKDDETGSIIRSRFLLLPFEIFPSRSNFNPQAMRKS